MYLMLNLSKMSFKCALCLLSDWVRIEQNYSIKGLHFFTCVNCVCAIWHVFKVANVGTTILFQMWFLKRKLRLYGHVDKSHCNHDVTAGLRAVRQIHMDFTLHKRTSFK